MRRTVLAAIAFLACSACRVDANVGSDDLDAGKGDAANAAEAASLPEASADAAVGIPDVVGTYTLVLKADANGCAFAPWDVGSVTTASAVISQAGPTVSAEVQGLAAVTFGLLLGTTKLEGTVQGATLRLFAAGKNQGQVLNVSGCDHTVDAEVEAVVFGDALERGRIVYRRNFGANANACAAHACTSEESFTALRATGDR